nr:hypothetical protein [Tanacetum cinerariifolium]
GQYSYPSKTKKPQPQKKERPGKEGQCHHCKGVGHWKRNFPIYLDELKKKKSGQMVASTSLMENQLGKTIKALRSDRGGEYISQEFKDYLKACEIVQQVTPPYTSQHNGVSERRNQTAARILNMVPTKKVDKTPYELWHIKVPNLSYLKVDKTPYELWHRKVPNLSYLKVWGCEAHVKRHTADKLKQRSVKCIFIGYPKETMGYYLYYPPENKVVVE